MSGLKGATAPLKLVTVNNTLGFNGTFTEPGPLVTYDFLGLIKCRTMFLPLTILLKFSRSVLITVVVVLNSTAAMDYCVVTGGVSCSNSFASNIIVAAALLDSFAVAV